MEGFDPESLVADMWRWPKKKAAGDFHGSSCLGSVKTRSMRGTCRGVNTGFTIFPTLETKNSDTGSVFLF